MSVMRIPAPNNQHKPLDVPLPLLDENLSIRAVYGVLRIDGPLLPSPQPAEEPEPPAKPKRRRSPRTSGLYTVLHAAQQHGITHPTLGGFLQLPREFDAILALEHKAVAQVVLEVLRQTIGMPEFDEHGHAQRREWATISQEHFARAGLMTKKAAWRGIKDALDKGYILRRKVGAQRYAYAIRWRGTN